MELNNVYEKTLTYTDVTQKFPCPTGFLGKLVPVLRPGSEAPVDVVDECGKSYTFRLTVRSESPNSQKPYYPKPEFQFKEWHEFVVEKGLKEKETIYFWLDDKNRLRVKVRVRPFLLRLFGANVIA